MDNSDNQLQIDDLPESERQQFPYRLSWMLRLGFVTWVVLGGAIGLAVSECLKGSESGDALLKGIVVSLGALGFFLLTVLYIIPQRFYGEVMSRYEHLYVAQPARIKDAPWFEFYPRYTSGISSRLKALGVVYVVSYVLFSSVMGAFLVIVIR